MSTIIAPNHSEMRSDTPHRISHFKVKGPWALNHFLEKYLQFNPLNFSELLELGSIYLNGKRLNTNDFDRALSVGDYLRVHTQPRRFQVPKKIQEHIFAETEDFIVFYKPHGLPCHPTLDNKKENVLTTLQAYLRERDGQNSSLFLCHRIDMGTQGLLLIAKSKDVQTYFMENWKSVRKIYHAWTSGPTLDVGLLEHWMRPHPRAPKIIARRAVEGWHLCQLNILKVFENEKKTDAATTTHLSKEIIETPVSIISDANETNESIKSSESMQFHNKYEIALLTGRTHQIRAQLSFEQNPIMGDTMYGSPFYLKDNLSNGLGLNGDKFELYCQELTFNFKDKEYSYKL